LEPGYQADFNTNEFARLIGEAFNMSPLKIEYVLKGYGGTIGGYVLAMTDAILRQATDRDYIAPNIDRIPVLSRFLQTEYGGGLQQQFYELRQESDKFIQTTNLLKKQGRYDEAIAYMKSNYGLASTRPQVLALERYLTAWRRQRDKILMNDFFDPETKKRMIRQMEMSRDMRLAYVPELREQSDIPLVTLGL
jgi:hypothetical protein